MKTLNILAISIGLALFPLAHADNTPQTGGAPTAAPAGSADMNDMPGMKMDSTETDKGAGNHSSMKSQDMSGGKMDDMGKMGGMGKKDCMGKMGAMGKMGGMDKMGNKQDSMEERFQALEKRVDLLQAVVEKLLQK